MTNGRVIPLDDVIFRKDLYPRQAHDPVKVQDYASSLEVLPPIELNDGWHRWIENSLEVSFGFLFRHCPQSIAGWRAGVIREGVFYPAGSVARHFYERLRIERPRRPPPHVYFIRSERGGPVKIGIARNIGRRLASLQTAHPYRLQIIAVIPHGGARAERMLHERFARHQLLGEWFEWNAEFEEILDESKN